MIDASKAQSTVNPSVAPAGVSPRLRLWIPIVLLSAFWAFLVANYTLDLAMFPRFLSRMIAYVVLLVGFLAWWLTNRSFTRRDRWLAVAVMVLMAVIGSFAADPTVDPFALVMSALPFALTLWIVALLVTRRGSPVAQRIGIYSAIAIAFGLFTLVRWEGLDGRQIPQFSWRWNPTPEQLFLESRHQHEVAGSLISVADKKEWTLQPGDWPEFRGPNRDSIVTGIKTPLDWDANPPKLLWRKRVGPAWSSMIIVDGRLVTQEQRGELEAIVCYDAATGRELWSHEDTARFFEGLAGVGPRATPTFSDGRVYAFGATGMLTCLAANNGKLLWSHDIAAEAGAQPPQWGYSTSPLVVNGKVIAFAGGEEGRSVLAYDATSGDRVWTQSCGSQTYSSPQLIEIGGKKQIVMHDNRALVGLNIDDGEVLWQHANSSELAVPMLQPHRLNDRELLIPWDPGIARLEVKNGASEWTVAERWTTNRLKPGFNDFVVHGEHIYGLDDGILSCTHLADGRRLWKKGRYGHGQLLLLADQSVILVLGEKGEVTLVAANPKQLEELGRFQAIDGKTWNHPVIAHGRLYVRNAEEMACYELARGGDAVATLR
jgi:outer membrane protein assembly factor BamB